MVGYLATNALMPVWLAPFEIRIHTLARSLEGSFAMNSAIKESSCVCIVKAVLTAMTGHFNPAFNPTVSTLTGHSNCMHCVAFRSDVTLALGGNDCYHQQGCEDKQHEVGSD